jgi:hypothetical protein
MGEFVADKEFDKRDELLCFDTDVAEQILEKTITVFNLVYHYNCA